MSIQYTEPWFEPTTFSSNVYYDRAVIVHKKRPGNDHEKKKNTFKCFNFLDGLKSNKGFWQ